MMKVYLADHMLGVFAFNTEGELIEKVTWGTDPEEIAEYLMKIEKGEYPKEYYEILKNIKDKYPKATVIVEVEQLASLASSLKIDSQIQPRHLGAEVLRRNIPRYAVEFKLCKSVEEYYKLVHEVSMALTRKKIKEAAEKRDLLAAQGIRAIDDLDKTINLFATRLREWYSLHFPELNDLVRDHEEYARIVSEIGLRNNFTLGKLVDLGFSEGKAKNIVEAASESMGADIAEFDLEPIKTLADITLQLYKLRADIAEYISVVMREVAPNITALVGPLLGARLISLAGGLDELARMPASTIQVLGAEKALFRALRTGTKPPKHGVIFQFPEIHRSPRWQRGKIARALAGKLAIAARIDAFTGQYLGEQLRESLEKRIEEVKKVYAKPPPRPREVKKPRKKEKSRKRSRR